MASLVLGAVGAAVGAAVGGPSGAMWGWSLGTTLGGVLFPPKLGNQDVGRLNDLRPMSSQYGVTIPQVYGIARIPGNVMWAEDFKEHVKKHRAPKGGGGGIKEYSYTCSFAVGVCRGPVVAIHRIWGDDLLVYDDSATPRSAYIYSEDGGTVAAGTVHDLTIYLGDEAQTPDPLMEGILGAGNVPAYRGLAYVLFENLVLTDWGSRIPSLTFEVETAEGSVQAILSDVFGQVGLDTADYDVSECSQSVTGFMVTNRMPARDAVDPLLRAYATDLTEVDDIVKAVPRGGVAVLDVDPDDMGAHLWDAGGGGTGDSPPARLESQRTTELELPQRVDVQYFSRSASSGDIGSAGAGVSTLYPQMTQSASRYTKPWAADALSVDLPLILTDDEAKGIAERILYTVWLERMQHKVSLPPSYLKLVPGSIVTLPTGFGTEEEGTPTSQRCRVIGADVGLPGPVQLTLVPDDLLTLQQPVGAVEGAGSGSNYVQSPAAQAVVPTTFAVWSAPLLRDEDGILPGFYVAATGPTGWAGCEIFYSSDGGTDWISGGTARDRAILGAATTALADFSTPDGVDSTDTVDVTVSPYGTLAATSQANVDAGDNTCLLGVEVLGFTTPTLLSGTSYRLSVLKRGRRETVMTGHTNTDRFIVLGPELTRVSVASNLVGSSVLVKCVSPGQVLSDVTAQSVTIAAASPPYPTQDDALTYAMLLAGGGPNG